MGREHLDALEGPSLTCPTRSAAGEIGEFQPGTGMLARRTKAQVLPIRLVGIRDVLPKATRMPCRATVEVRMGEQLEVRPGEGARAFTVRLETAGRPL